MTPWVTRTRRSTTPSQPHGTRSAPQLCRTEGPAALLPNGKVLVVGLHPSGGTSEGTDGEAMIYNPATGSWASAPAAGGFPYSLTLRRDGRVLAAGEDNFCSLCEPADTSSNGGELFDARTGTRSVTGSMIDPQGRPGHAGVLLLNGSLLAAGGATAPASLPRSSTRRQRRRRCQRAAPSPFGEQIHPATALFASPCATSLAGSNQ